MSDYVVIADVGDTLRKLLWENMRHDPGIYPAVIDSEDDITLSSPQDNGEGGKLSLFLYHVLQNSFLKNKEMERIDSGVLRYPPTVLDLFYLITPLADERKKDHILLGKVIQVFHDNAIIKGSGLTGSLEGTIEELRVVMHTLPFDQLLQMWQSFSEKSFTLSVCYQVTPIRIDSARELETRRIVNKA
jgi:hypothetical protein